MAIKVKTDSEVRCYCGLSSDSKPVSTGEGTIFEEVNTGLTWVYHDGYWYEDLRLIYALSQALNGGR